MHAINNVQYITIASAVKGTSFNKRKQTVTVPSDSCLFIVCKLLSECVCACMCIYLALFECKVQVAA